MTFREVLQTELWSKRTTQKIWIGFGIVVAVLLVVAGVERYWLTPSERSAGQIALAKIDDLQNADSMTDEAFGTRDVLAKNQVGAADRAAWTFRDRVVVGLLEEDLMYTEMLRKDRMVLDRLKNSENERVRKLYGKQLETSRDLDGKISEIRAFVGTHLHQLLG